MRPFVIAIQLLLTSVYGISQDTLRFSLSVGTLVPVKRECSCDSAGYKIQILEGSFTVELHKNHPDKVEIDCAYSYESVHMCSMEQKVRLLKELMTFLNDTSITCVKAKPYSMLSRNFMSRLQHIRYSLQIDVLYHINFICFGTYAPSYSPFPVLYDTRSKKEINSDLKKVQAVCDIYRTWLENCFKNGFQNYGYPLVGTPYRWRFGAIEKKTFMRLPELNPEMSDRTGKPKIFD